MVRLLVLPLRIYWVSVYIRSCHRQYEPSSQQLLSREFGEAYKNVLICSDIPFGHGTCKYGTVGILHLPRYVVAFLRGWSSFDSFKTRLQPYSVCMLRILRKANVFEQRSDLLRKSIRESTISRFAIDKEIGKQKYSSCLFLWKSNSTLLACSINHFE